MTAAATRITRSLVGVLLAGLVLGGCATHGDTSKAEGRTPPLPFANTTDAELAHTTTGWKQVFADDFDDRRLDRTKWRTRFQKRSGLRRCAAPAADQVRVRRGHAVLGIERVRRTDECPHGLFKNAMIGTGGEADPGFQGGYGLFAARVKFQSGRGQHGAFWLQGTGERSAEIDVAEYYGAHRADGGLSTLVHQTVDGSLKSVGGLRRRVATILGPDQTPSNSWHVWSVQWSPRGYVFRVDDTVIMRTHRNVSHDRQFLVLSLLTSDWELPALDTTRSTMKVDWVRVWQRSG